MRGIVEYLRMRVRLYHSRLSSFQLMSTAGAKKRAPFVTASASGSKQACFGSIDTVDGINLTLPILPEFAIAKAFTICAFRAVSPRFPDGVVIQKWFQECNPQLMMNASVLTGGKIYASGGCSPIFRGNEMIGAYGICGPTSQQDDEISDYARAKAGWAKAPEHDDTPESVKKHVNEIYTKLGLHDRKL